MEMMMSTDTHWQQRVIDERADLDSRLRSLRHFIGSPEFDAIPTAEQHLLLRQALHMADYEAVLDQRIAGFKAGG
jgi:hypothetical protein